MRCAACGERIDGDAWQDYDGRVHPSCFIARRTEMELSRKGRRFFSLDPWRRIGAGGARAGQAAAPGEVGIAVAGEAA